MNKQALTGEVTPEKIAEWKANHKEVFAITVDGHIAYLRKPDRKTISYASSIGSKDPIKFSEIMLKNCWLGGSDSIQTDDSLFLAASGKLTDLIEVKEAELVKL